MSRKRIEEMAKVIDEFWKGTIGANFNEAFLECFATSLYAKGVRKQREGEWVFKPTMSRTPSAINYTCSLCDFESARTTPFCPNCGAKMKGGGE